MRNKGFSAKRVCGVLLSTSINAELSGSDGKGGETEQSEGNCWDTACAESFFKTLKQELETLDGKHSAGEVRQSVFMYIEAYYNRVRLHSGLDYRAPDVFNSGQAASIVYT
jgi:hypothetical protein